VYTQPIGKLDPFDELDGESHQQKFQEIIPKFQHHSHSHPSSLNVGRAEAGMIG